jgi:hypothetical protein
MGKGNRELQALPVLHLRESATKMGLLRKQHGMLSGRFFRLQQKGFSGLRWSG